VCQIWAGWVLLRLAAAAAGRGGGQRWRHDVVVAAELAGAVAGQQWRHHRRHTALDLRPQHRQGQILRHPFQYGPPRASSHLIPFFLDPSCVLWCGWVSFVLADVSVAAHVRLCWQGRGPAPGADEW
jgi:hypothetical protein